MENSLENISRVNEYDEELLNKVLQRYCEIFPEWEIATISLCKGKDKKEQLDRIIAMLQEWKTLT